MKARSPVIFAGILLAASAGLLRWGPTPSAAAFGQAVLEQRLGGLLTAAPETPSAATAPAGTAAPALVPVTIVEEAWDEQRRLTRGEETVPQEVRVEGEVSLELRNETDYQVSFPELPALPAGLELNTGEPVVLIVHTHGTESYSTGDPEQESYRSRDPAQSVLAVGEALAETLRSRGYGVIHDQTLCDYPEYTGAYDRSRERIRENLADYPSIVLVLDVHRDAVETAEGGQMRMACTSAEGELAQMMLVVGSDDGGLEHPLWRQNLALAAVLQMTLERQTPGLMRAINLRSERFNQDLGAMSLLVEMGASGNTLEEAIGSAERLGAALGDVMDRYSGKSS